MVTLELGLDQRASICQMRRRGEEVQAEGTTKAEIWRTTRKGTREVLSMPETESGTGTAQPHLQRSHLPVKEIVLFSKGNGEPWKVLSRGWL